MSCINLDIRMLNEPLVLSTERIGRISVSTSLFNKLIKINTFDAVIHPIINVKVIPSLKVNVTQVIDAFLLKVFNIEDNLKVKIKNIEDFLNVKITPLYLENNLKTTITKLEESLYVVITNISKDLKVRTSIVCSIGNRQYLNVSPDEIQWITPDCGVIYTVESNTKWIISNS